MDIINCCVIVECGCIWGGDDESAAFREGFEEGGICQLTGGTNKSTADEMNEATWLRFALWRVENPAIFYLFPVALSLSSSGILSEVVVDEAFQASKSDWWLRWWQVGGGGWRTSSSVYWSEGTLPVRVGISTTVCWRPNGACSGSGFVQYTSKGLWFQSDLVVDTFRRVSNHMCHYVDL